ncbi:Uncharacterized protein FKW44_022576 [Caligus rogercresseyi]|uniref:Uncharacterized protein n=1 Tax=Caligus rogercresseyi TaxID=217165 RepID=A0A7T8GNK9_CALRO|nr:Uncharacterized protein FKW44_022576 [Caligus rogercresseyi]
MEEEKKHAMFTSFRAGRSPKEVIEFFNYPKLTVYDQTDEFVAEAKRKVNKDGNKSYANRSSPTPSTRTFQQDSAPAHKSKETQAWLLENLPYHWSPDLWPPSSPDCNPLDYFNLGMVENKTNKHAHNTLDSLRAAIVEEFANMNKHRLEMVVAADGGYIEISIYVCPSFNKNC